MNVVFSVSALEGCPFSAIFILVGVMSLEKRLGAVEGGGNVEDVVDDDIDDGNEDETDCDNDIDDCENDTDGLYDGDDSVDDKEIEGADTTVVGVVVRQSDAF